MKVCYSGEGAWRKAVLTAQYSALGKLPDASFICCCCGLCMSYHSVIISGVRRRKEDRKIDSKPVVVKIVVTITLNKLLLLTDKQ